MTEGFCQSIFPPCWEATLHLSSFVPPEPNNVVGPSAVLQFKTQPLSKISCQAGDLKTLETGSSNNEDTLESRLCQLWNPQHFKCCVKTTQTPQSYLKTLFHTHFSAYTSQAFKMFVIIGRTAKTEDSQNSSHWGNLASLRCLAERALHSPCHPLNYLMQEAFLQIQNHLEWPLQPDGAGYKSNQSINYVIIPFNSPHPTRTYW